MKRFGLRNRNRSAGKVITAALVGSVIGATVGLLMAPATGEEMRRRLRAGAMDAGEKLKTAAGKVENRARELAADARDQIGEARGAVSHRNKATTATMPEVRG